MSGFRFRTSWGAEFCDGQASFRIWAPSQDRMVLRIVGQDAHLPMQAAGGGWHEFTTDELRPGIGYEFVLADGMAVNDPAARAQVNGVHGPSQLVDPTAYQWRTADWTGRPWEETVFYELHTGTFSPEGDFDGVRRRLDHLADTGITAIELLPVAAFSGNRGWGYDGVLLYAPHRAYGGPEALKRLVDAAHERGLMMFLDVVYNHFGPDGNYIQLYAPDFFHPEHQTPWGGAIAYEKKPVRDYFIENALYWLEEYRFDGLRLDAVDHIDKQSDEPLLEELAAAVRTRISGRHVHLTTEDDRNITRLHERDDAGRVRLYSAEWNDDVHHAAHAIASGESEGYYSDFANDAVGHLARALASGFVYQGEPSPFRHDAPRGEPSGHLPPTAFVNFLQNHDQIGNRAFSERLTDLAQSEMLAALTAVLLLAPQIPLLFMGEEWGETRPFSFFTDFHGELGAAVREGRRREFERWPGFASEANRAKIPDPNAETTFAASQLDWDKLVAPAHRRRLDLVRRLLDTRRREIVPRLPKINGHAGAHERLADDAIVVRWRTDEGECIMLHANLGAAPVPLDAPVLGRVVFRHGQEGAATPTAELPPYSVVLSVEAGAPEAA